MRESGVYMQLLWLTSMQVDQLEELFFNCAYDTNNITLFLPTAQRVIPDGAFPCAPRLRHGEFGIAGSGMVLNNHTPSGQVVQVMTGVPRAEQKLVEWEMEAYLPAIKMSVHCGPFHTIRDYIGDTTLNLSHGPNRSESSIHPVVMSYPISQLYMSSSALWVPGSNPCEGRYVGQAQSTRCWPRRHQGVRRVRHTIHRGAGRKP
jgi:hypothetical protein